MDEIVCIYCGGIGTRSLIHKGGWQLAKNRPFAYVCTNCTHKERTP